MLAHPTLDKLHQLKFLGMATALAEQLDATDIDALSFDERFALLVDRELTYRDDRRMSSRLRRAKLRHNACLEDINYRHPRTLDKSLMLSFSTCRWLKEHLNVLITGPTGIGKTWIACALAHQAHLHEHADEYFWYVATDDDSRGRLRDLPGPGHCHRRRHGSMCNVYLAAITQPVTLRAG